MTSVVCHDPGAQGSSLSLVGFPTEDSLLFCDSHLPRRLHPEIYEQTDSSLRAMSLGGRLLSNNKVMLGGLESRAPQQLALHFQSLHLNFP